MSDDNKHHAIHIVVGKGSSLDVSIVGLCFRLRGADTSRNQRALTAVIIMLSNNL